MLPYHTPNTVEAGCDEAGRGCLAGPVVAAAVILPPDFHDPRLRDSKKMTDANRQALRTVIEAEAVAYSVAFIDALTIDSINILQASFAAMHDAVSRLALAPELLLIDGNRFVPYVGISHVCIIRGDDKYAAIAAASVLAKTYRDEYMQHLATTDPNYAHYGWHTNKGYPTAAHRAAIAKHGVTPLHRLTFGGVKEYIV